jgi:hypothetical protein
VVVALAGVAVVVVVAEVMGLVVWVIVSYLPSLCSFFSFIVPQTLALIYIYLFSEKKAFFVKKC